MTLRLTDHARRLLEAALAVREPVTTLGRSIWLYLLLITSANHRGFVLHTREYLSRALAVPEETIEVWLGRLADAGLVRVVSPAPYLVIALQFWSGDGSATSADAVDSSGNPPSPLDKGPVYGNSHSHADAIALEKKRDGGAGEGADLHAELRAIMPDADSAEINRILSHYPASTITKTLERVRRTPASKIRKSRVALFRYLLAKFSQEIDIDEL